MQYSRIDPRSYHADLSTTTLIKPLPVLLFIQEHCKKEVRNFRDADWQKVD